MIQQLKKFYNAYNWNNSYMLPLVLKIIYNVLINIWKTFYIYFLIKFYNFFINLPEFEINNFRKQEININYLNFESKYENIVYISLILSLVSNIRLFLSGIAAFSTLTLNLNTLFLIMLNLSFFYLLSNKLLMKKILCRDPDPFLK